jgi:hypothetical protein
MERLTREEFLEFKALSRKVNKKLKAKRELDDYSDIRVLYSAGAASVFSLNNRQFRAKYLH